jgi:hypothetical protein
MHQQTEQRMGRVKWAKILSDLQKKVRTAKRIGPDGREDLMNAMAIVAYIIQNTGRGRLVRIPRGQKLRLTVEWVSEK